MIHNEDEYRRMADCEQRLWWYLVLHRLTHRIIQQEGFDASAKILDLGCGTGGLVGYLQKRGFSSVTGVDVSPYAVKIAKENGLEIQQGDIRQIDHSTTQLFDVVVAHDVLYFVDAEQLHSFWQNLSHCLKPGALLLINMPALSMFSGSHDLAVGIKQRISRDELPLLVCHQDFSVTQSFYWPVVFSPPNSLVRYIQRRRLRRNVLDQQSIVSDISMPPFLLNGLFQIVSNSEWFFRKMVPWGSSLFFTCRFKHQPADSNVIGES
jgi:2-polyprenyl-3-methyl-5-hydroxy-6-metoxy-1,4-benzoquinol methylase